jgi:hypothetical protein
MAATLAAAIAQPSLAVPITDTDITVIGDQEWAQVDLFTNLTWIAL